MSAYVVRFSLKQRIEHLLAMLVFTLLCITGLPQKFYVAAWAERVVEVFGGIDRLRGIHRASGILLASSTVVHFGGAFAAILSRRVGLAMIPARKDFEDAIGTLRYYLGVSKVHPKFDRYDYRQKFEYWGLVMGNMVMLGTGFILLAPTVVTRVAPGQLVAAARVAHSNEGMMAFLVIAIWHIYNSFLAPEVFPIDTSIFTGRISLERMEHEHPLEFARRTEEPEPAPAGEADPALVAPSPEA